MAKILVVDDDRFYLNLITDLLAGEDNVVVQTRQISQARKLMLENTFDIVIADLHTGYPYSGRELALLKKPATTIITSTDANALADLQGHGIINGSILKPFSIPILLNILEFYIPQLQRLAATQ